MKQTFKQLSNNISIPILLMLVLSLFSCSTTKQGQEDKKVEKIISKMTLKQKAELLIGTGFDMKLPDSIAAQYGFLSAEYGDSDYDKMVEHVRTYLPGAAGFTAEFPSLGITSQVLSDGPAGLRIKPKRENDSNTYYCTAFPIATVLASSWDTDLVYKVGKAMGNEVLEYGSDVLLAPGMNIQRDPLCGRNFEYYSEDPLVTGKIAAAMVNGIQSNGVGTSVKHFVANNQETNRLSVNTIVSERALREIYLKGFEIAVKEAQPWTVMSSYNMLNGVYTSECEDLLTKILRNDWGFEGYVMTDWGGGSDVVAQMKAGNDLIMPGIGDQIKKLINSVKEGTLDEAVLDRNLSRILTIMMKTPGYKGIKATNNPDLKAHAQVTRQAASDGMVLLENKAQALPIAMYVKKIAAFGNTSYEFIAGGTGSGDVNEAYTVSLTEGLDNGGFETDAQLETVYKKYIKEERAKAKKSDNWITSILGAKLPVDEMKVSQTLARKMAIENDCALITIGRNSGEGGDRKAIPGDFYLTDIEKDLIEEVSKAFHAEGKKAIVILNIGGVIETASWKDIPDAVLLAWQPGQEGGNSVVDVLSGKVNPSGKLAVSFPISYDDAPTAKTFPGVAVESDEVDDAADLSGFSFSKRVPWEVVYQEDIYVGYRYYNTFRVPVSYEFGYGLSYTDFEYSNLKLVSNQFDGKLTASVEITNKGAMAGREVVQVYASAPSGKIDKPEEELVAFGKTKLLLPGEKEVLTFEITTKDLASFAEDRSSWVAEAGTYTLKIGASSKRIKKEATFELSNEFIASTVSKALTPDRNIEKFKPKSN
ncbi:glycoside hydrolase family 3 N-terminal domain-containing protein [Mangrovibacterium lignilyticum]|uniref:glycoside hydrolase family 3 N-terminal domain-containing protein n=1 Tax=Mangrovibacterium lignilyticum TaxID=2668052 RepID=UPI001EE585C8|nr:glycoside hydrolase family 3 N-terminal domain-containing protein [Mangrovibacterium lignilyticum]